MTPMTFYEGIMYMAFPGSDHYEGSVAIGTAPVGNPAFR